MITKTTAILSAMVAAWMLLVNQSTLAATATWTGAGDGVSWNSSANWSGGVVPTATSDVVIGAIAGSPVIKITSAVSINSLNCNEPLSMTAGSLTLAATSNISAALTVNSSTLTVSGTGTLLNVTGTTTLTGANLYAQNGAILLLPAATSYTGHNSANTTPRRSGRAAALTSRTWRRSGVAVTILPTAIIITTRHPSWRRMAARSPWPGRSPPTPPARTAMRSR